MKHSREASSHTIILILAGLIVLFLLIWQGARLWQNYYDRSNMLWQLEEEAAAWIRSETDETAVILANERIADLAQRQTTVTSSFLPPNNSPADLQELLSSEPVDYLVTSNELFWQQLQNLVGFRLAYEPVKQFDSPYIPQAPITIWALREPLSGLGQRYPINARVPDRIWIIGYQIGPQQIRPGEAVKMALFIESPEATIEATTPFQAVVRLISPVDSSTVREWTVDLPQSISPEEWQPQQVIVEEFPLVLPDDLEPGAYLINLSLLGPDSDEFWPISLDKDVNRLDRVATGTIIVPSDESFENVNQIEATFDNGAILTGFEIKEDFAGDNLEVTLVWNAGNAVIDDYIVFVHLVDNSGQLAANHDSVPGNGRFPTRAWQPGIPIPDTHTIPLPPDLPPGEYELKVGLYDPQSGQRSAITETSGLAADNTILITSITIP